ncbi:hypothetical protein Tco_0838404 [Tanacetum coccineum]|uniref:Retrotransposon gag domain-containing protein n=1 Tax=Tanacetum coccineum TaxID=301880 RepID=A0ABQ5AQY2_9ASTR
MASDGSDPDAEYALSKLLQMGTVAEYQNEFEMLIKRVTTPKSLLKSFYISGLKPALQCALFRSNPKTLEEAFSLALAAEARFTNQQLWELLRSYPLTSGESVFRARITEAHFEDENNQAVDTNVGDQEDPNVKEKQEVKKADDLIKNIKDEEGKNVEDVRIESVDEDELNIVISVLKDGDGEFDDRLNEINLDLSHEFVIRVLENRDVFGESLVVLLNPIWVPILWGVSGVNKSSFANKDVAMGKEAKRIWDPGIKIFFRHHLEDKVIVKEWGMIHPG